MSHAPANAPSPTPSGASLDLDSPQLQRLVDVIARGNPRGVRALGYRHGYTLQRGDGLADFCRYFLRHNGPEGFDELVCCHPHRELILDVCGRESGEAIHPQTDPYAYAMDSFTGGAQAPDLGTVVAYAAVNRRESLRQLLNRLGGPTLRAAATDIEVGQRALSVLRNASTAEQRTLMAFLNESEESGFAVEAIATATGAIIGGVSSVLTAGQARKQAAEQSRSQLTMQVLGQRAAREQQKADQQQALLQTSGALSAKKLTMYALVAVVALLVIAGVLVVVLRQPKS